MNLKKFKLDSYNKIIDDYKNNQDIYMFFLYPLIIKLKSKNFKDYKYSIFLKLKNKQPVPFKEYNTIKKYTKKNLDKDIKIIIKCIFWSDYIDKNNIYAIYYLKKHLSTKKQTSINLINLLYRLLTNAPTKITGGMFENTRKNLGVKASNVVQKASNVAQKAKAAVTNKVSSVVQKAKESIKKTIISIIPNSDEINNFFTILKNFYKRESNIIKSISFNNSEIEIINKIIKLNNNLILYDNIFYYNLIKLYIYCCYHDYNYVNHNIYLTNFNNIKNNLHKKHYLYFECFIEDMKKINEMTYYVIFLKNKDPKNNIFSILKEYLLLYLKQYYNFLDTNDEYYCNFILKFHKYFMYIYMNNVYNIYKFFYINYECNKSESTKLIDNDISYDTVFNNVKTELEFKELYNSILKKVLEDDLKDVLEDNLEDDLEYNLKNNIIKKMLSDAYLINDDLKENLINNLISNIYKQESISKYIINKYYYIIFLINMELIENLTDNSLIKFINKYNKKILKNLMSELDDIAIQIKKIMNIELKNNEEVFSVIKNNIETEIAKNKKKIVDIIKITNNIEKLLSEVDLITIDSTTIGGNLQGEIESIEKEGDENRKDMVRKENKKRIKGQYNYDINKIFLIDLLQIDITNINDILSFLKSIVMYENPSFIDKIKSDDDIFKELIDGKKNILIKAIKNILNFKEENIESIKTKTVNIIGIYNIENYFIEKIFNIYETEKDLIDKQFNINKIINKYKIRKLITYSIPDTYKESDDLLEISKIYYKSLIFFLDKKNTMYNFYYQYFNSYPSRSNMNDDAQITEKIIKKNTLKIKKIRNEQNIKDNIETIQQDISKFILNLNQGTAITGGNTKIQNTKLKLLIQHIISHLS